MTPARALLLFNRNTPLTTTTTAPLSRLLSSSSSSKRALSFLVHSSTANAPSSPALSRVHLRTPTCLNPITLCSPFTVSQLRNYASGSPPKHDDSPLLDSGNGHFFRNIITAFKDRPEGAAQAFALLIIRKDATTFEVLQFLEYAVQDVVTRSAIISVMFDEIDAIEASGQNITKSLREPVSASPWTPKELEYFNIHFELVDKESMFPPAAKKASETPALKCFLKKNAFVKEGYFTSKNPKQWGTSTKFSRLLYFARSNRLNESSVVDLVKYLMNLTFCHELFLVKTRYPLKLKMSAKKGGAMAIPDVIVMQHVPETRVEKIGVVIVENKRMLAEDSNNPFFEPTEAELVAQTIAAAQGKSWTGEAIYAIRVIGRRFTFYRADYTQAVLRDISQGLRRKVPFTIKKHVGETDVNGLCDEFGYNIELPEERSEIIEILHRMSEILIARPTIVKSTTKGPDAD